MNLYVFSVVADGIALESEFPLSERVPKWERGKIHVRAKDCNEAVHKAYCVYLSLRRAQGAAEEVGDES